MNPYSIPPLVSALLFACLGLLVFNQNRKSVINRSYLYFCITTVFWQGTWTILFNTQNPALANILVRFGYSFIVFLPVTFYQFNITLLRNSTSRLSRINFLIGTLFVIAAWTSNKFIAGYYEYSWGFYPKAGVPWHPIFLGFLSYLALMSNVELIKELSKSDIKPLRKIQLKYVLMANITYTLAATDFLVNYGVGFYPIGVLTIIISLSIIAYSILRLKLMDFNLVMRWGLAYFILISIIVAIFIPTAILSDRLLTKIFHFMPGVSILLAVCLSVLIFDPLRNFITRFVDLIIFKSPDFQSILVGVEEIIKNEKELTPLCEKLILNFKNIWGVEHAGLLIWDFHQSSFKLMPEKAFSEQIIMRVDQEIGENDFLVRTLENEKRLFPDGIIVEDEVTNFGASASPGERTTFWKIRRTMRWLGASICVPLLSEAKLIGFIVLGPKRNKSIYNNEDKKFLSHVAENITTAIRSFVFPAAVIKKEN